MLSLLLLTGCAALFTGPVSAPPPPPAASMPGGTAADTPVSFAPLEARLNDLLGASNDADQRDRLIALRELLFDLRGREPAAQRVAYAYASGVLDIESRARAQPLDIGVVAPVEESALEEPTYAAPTVPPVDALQTARAALAAGRPLDAVAALGGLVSTEAAALRKEAADTWARTEREAAGYAFIEARKLVEPAARLAALTTVRDRLTAINARFPDNAHAADIRANLVRVQSDVDAAAKDASR